MQVIEGSCVAGIRWLGPAAHRDRSPRPWLSHSTHQRNDFSVAYFHVLEHAYEQTHTHTCMYACTYVCILLLHQCVDASITKASPDLCGSVKSTAVVLRPGTTVRNMPVSTDSAKPWTTRQRSQSLKVCMNVRNYVHKYMCLNCTVLHCIALAWIGLYCFVLYCL